MLFEVDCLCIFIEGFYNYEFFFVKIKVGDYMLGWVKYIEFFKIIFDVVYEFVYSGYK